MYGGLFNGLWGGISTTLGQGAAEISEMTGSADAKRAQELKLAQLANEDKIRQEQNKKTFIILGVVAGTIILLFLISTLKNKKYA